MDKIKPTYYKKNGIDVIALTQIFKLNFEIGNVLKYCIRAGNKDPEKEIEDLEKAQEYLSRRIEHLKKDQKISEEIAEQAGKELHDFIKKYTGLDTYKDF